MPRRRCGRPGRPGFVTLYDDESLLFFQRLGHRLVYAGEHVAPGGLLGQLLRDGAQAPLGKGQPPCQQAAAKASRAFPLPLRLPPRRLNRSLCIVPLMDSPPPSILRGEHVQVRDGDISPLRAYVGGGWSPPRAGPRCWGNPPGWTGPAPRRCLRCRRSGPAPGLPQGHILGDLLLCQRVKVTRVTGGTGPSGR